MSQFSLDLPGGAAFDPNEGAAGLAPGRGELGSTDFLPPGPYSTGLTHGEDYDSPPWTVCCGDGRAVAGHIPSLAIAQAIAAALNRR